MIWYHSFTYIFYIVFCCVLYALRNFLELIFNSIYPISSCLLNSIYYLSLISHIILFLLFSIMFFFFNPSCLYIYTFIFFLRELFCNLLSILYYFLLFFFEIHSASIILYHIGCIVFKKIFLFISILFFSYVYIYNNNNNNNNYYYILLYIIIINYC